MNIRDCYGNGRRPEFLNPFAFHQTVVKSVIYLELCASKDVHLHSINEDEQKIYRHYFFIFLAFLQYIIKSILQMQSND